MKDMVFPDHGANLEWAARRYGIETGMFIDFSSNVNPLGPPASAVEAARASVNNIRDYPEPNGDRLKKAIATGLYQNAGIKAESIIVGNGSTELMYLLCRFLNVEKVTVVAPAFSEYENAARAVGSEISYFNLDPGDDFTLDEKKLAAVASKTDLLFFCNPASPTGLAYTKEKLVPVINACEESGTTFVVDESYMGFLNESEIENCSLATEDVKDGGSGGLAIISTMTKLFALAGLRGPGYLIASPSLVLGLEGASPPWRVNIAADAAGIAASEDRDYLQRTRESVSQWRKELKAGLEKSGVLEIYPSNVNFLLARAKERISGEKIVDSLGRRGVLVRSCWNFHPLNGSFIRIAVRSPESNQKLLDALDEISAEVIV